MLDRAAVLTGVRAQRPDVELVDGDGEAPFLMAFADLSHRFDNGVAACLMAAVIGPVPSDRASDKVRDLSQTWAWDDAENVLQNATHTAVVTELLGVVHPPAARLGAFRAVLDAVVSLTRPIATWWPVSMTALPPDVALQSPLAGLVNVRFFRDTARPELSVMDTLGMESFDLPDVQCYFSGLDPNAVAGLLYDVAAYMIDGAVIRAGHTVQGLTAGQRWPVSVVTSLVAPSRPVLDLYPGPPHAGSV